MASKRAELRPATDPIDLDERDARALTEVMTVTEGGRARGADGLFEVTTQSGSEYLVDMHDGRCECWDDSVRSAGCKHRRRVAFATGRRPIPSWADRAAIDDDLGRFVAGEPDYQHFDNGGSAGAE
ncbi:hypothetical protein [Haloarcula pelagica]|uniref:hypothetical protein n=1 Tax=Haloarcula pelagica TaxID=3033389 RepID=UPI0024C395D8|nr:hypothetical protein [Halomicroarcula sp. YJ-61-S]